MRLIRALLFLLPLTLPAQNHWVATWATAQTLYKAPPRGTPAPPSPPDPARRFGIPAPLAAVTNQTVRMVARTSIGGGTVRIRLANAFGAPAVDIGAAHIALQADAGAIKPGTDRALTFSGKPAATLYAGETLISDPVTLNLPPLAHVAISLYIPGETADPTNHRFALHKTYISKTGDFTAQPTIPDAEIRESWYWLAGIDVLAPAATGALVTFGDSITDGDQSTPETDGDWPSLLAASLQSSPRTRSLAVVNAGISGNRLLGDNNSGLARLYHDALSQPGVRWMTVLIGINDITGGSRAQSITADTLIAAYRQVIENAHLCGVKVIGCTLTPYAGSRPYNDYGETVRTTLNQWIRTSGAFDAIVDFDAATRDPKDPKRYRPEADSPDMLHPANPGYKLMSDALATLLRQAIFRQISGSQH